VAKSNAVTTNTPSSTGSGTLATPGTSTTNDGGRRKISKRELIQSLLRPLGGKSPHRPSAVEVRSPPPAATGLGGPDTVSLPIHILITPC